MIRRTKQRAAIIRAFEEAGRPLSPLEIHQLGKRHYPSLGLRTVYRNLREMAQEGRVAGIDYPGQPVRYERITDKSYRPHFICKYCNKVFAMDKNVDRVPYQPPPGFAIEEEEVVFYGRCPSCKV
jgi:Fur family transcriptional regulator, ferric uptake regulator